MTRGPDDKSAVERLLEAGVYAPLGYVLTRSTTRPELIAAGRKQVAFSRSLGRAAIRSMTRGRKSTPVPAINVTAELTPGPPAELTPEPPAVEDAVAVDGYDEMTAKSIIAVVSSAPGEQLAWIVDHESANKQRVTVLRAASKRLELSRE